MKQHNENNVPHAAVMIHSRPVLDLIIQFRKKEIIMDHDCSY